MNALRGRKFALAVFAVAASIAIACGGGSGSETASGPAAAQTEAAQPTSTSTAANAVPTNDPMGGGEATVSPASGGTSGRSTSDAADPLKLGELVFMETAGGVGCAACHGTDARGDPEMAAPDIRGRTATDIYNALDTRVQMAFITLTSEEVTAVAAYLQALAQDE